MSVDRSGLVAPPQAPEPLPRRLSWRGRSVGLGWFLAAVRRGRQRRLDLLEWTDLQIDLMLRRCFSAGRGTAEVVRLPGRHDTFTAQLVFHRVVRSGTLGVKTPQGQAPQAQGAQESQRMMLERAPLCAGEVRRLRRNTVHLGSFWSGFAGRSLWGFVDASGSGAGIMRLLSYTPSGLTPRGFLPRVPLRSTHGLRSCAASRLKGP